jgi:hypothetical protein
MAVRSGGQQGLWTSELTQLSADLAISPRIAEDCRSVIESADYIVQYGDQEPAIICECCGTSVALMPERHTEDQSRTWKPGIWEPETFRRHTLRRCEWKRVNP